MQLWEAGLCTRRAKRPPESNAGAEVTRDFLVSQILRWSRMSDADAVLMEVGEVAARLMPWQNELLL